MIKPKIGILYCAYNCKTYLKESLDNFFKAKKDGLIDEICAVSLPFLEYYDINNTDDGTTEEIVNLYKEGSIDYTFTNPKYIKEHLARDLCLQYLKFKECDLFWLVDGDEFYSLKDIKNIISFVESNQEYCWYTINFKNYIFDGKQWIDGFCPSRIFRKNFNDFKIQSFYWDNDIGYEKDNKIYNYKDLPKLEVPKDIAHIKHLTWLHLNGKDKYEYQMKHFGYCGYIWNYELNQLEFNKEFYLKTNQQLPTIYYE